MRALLPLLLALLLPACAGGRLPPAAPIPALPPPPPAAYYAAPGPVPAPLSVELVRSRRWQVTTRVLLPPRLPPELETLSHATDPIEILVHVPSPAGGRRPLVVLSPVLANSQLLMSEFAAAFTRQGWIAAVVMRKEFDFDPARALDQAEGEFRTYVMQARQALDWLLTRDDVDPSRVATFGVSAGAVLGACGAAVDPRPVAHVLVLAGGPVADVLSETEEDRFVRYRGRLDAEGIAGGDVLRERLRRTLRTDPVALAPGVDREEVLLFVARQDRSVPTRYGMTLWEAMGRPALVLLPFGHKTSFVCFGTMVEASVRFIGRRFDAVGA